ncbi:hypothetical protein Pmar_PMAR004558 [Perkinsus marinus ATCC 50983]|uniref:Uncharacterized protein n=1 Tax=Perkinsus marinus (strain ATCC 50983 / TXsc) TaxID=423536 RepID=C5LJF5_PERM5|nr:hypothetical protein Pmar_PMAR004558 [Perkinsus marinus ATCC 50983]EER03139.1 hypothetical protein Pmar_PMAR004558 [Perkinsus marinus ATCC 50983]|eukprot:XP_002771323.1 hypothetical protein Pmar_PMAR004558 [Perkinsus marinus ATCC 50983]
MAKKTAVEAQTEDHPKESPVSSSEAQAEGQALEGTSSSSQEVVVSTPDKQALKKKPRSARTSKLISEIAKVSKESSTPSDPATESVVEVQQLGVSSVPEENAISRVADQFVDKLIAGLNIKSSLNNFDDSSKVDSAESTLRYIRRSGIGSFDAKLINPDRLAACIKDPGCILTDPLDSFCGDPELEKEGLAYFASCLLSWAVTVAILGICDWGLPMSHALHVLFSVQFSDTSNKFGGLPLCRAYDLHVRQGLAKMVSAKSITLQEALGNLADVDASQLLILSSRLSSRKPYDDRGTKRPWNDSWSSYGSHSNNQYWYKN